MNAIRDPYWLRFFPPSLRQRLVGRVNLHAVIHNSGWLLFDRLARTLLGLLVGTWVARYLGPANFGELAYILAYIAFFGAIANLGADGIIVRDIARDHEQVGRILGTAFAVRLLAGIICWIAAVGGMAWSNGIKDPSVVLTALAGGALVFQAADTIDLWFQSQSQSRRTVLAKLIAYLFSNGVKVVLILIQAPLVAFAAILALDALTAAVGLAIAYSRFPCNQRWNCVVPQGWQLLKESWPFILSGLSIMIYIRIDQIMIDKQLGSHALGIYAAALTFSNVWQFIPMTLYISFAPYVAKAKLDNEERYRELIRNIYNLYATVSWLVTLTIAISAPVIINLVFGAAYKDAAPILAIHILTLPFISLGVAQGLWITNEKQYRLALYKTIIGALICIVGNWLMIPALGLKGSAIAAVVANSVSAVFSNIFFSMDSLKAQLCALIFFTKAYKSLAKMVRSKQ